MNLVRSCALLCLLVPAAVVPAKAADRPDPFRPPAIKTSNVPVVPRALIDRLRQYQNVRSARFAGWAPDGRGMLIQTRFANTSQLHRVYKPLGYRRQLTYFKEPTGGRFIPGDKRGNLLLSKSAGGSEQNQIYYFNAATGRETLLTDGKSRNNLGPVLRDGSRMIFTSNKRNGRDTDMYIADTKPGGEKPKRILQTDKEYWYPVDWSPDRFTVLINRYVSINETYPALLDIVTGKKRPIPIPGGNTAAYGAMAFAPDGKSVYVACDAGGDFRQLARVDLKSFEYTWIPFSKEKLWDVTAIEVDRNSGMVAFTVNENGASALYFLGNVPADDSATLFPGGDSYVLEHNKPVRIPTPLGIIGSLEFSPDGKHLGFTLSRPDAPADAYSIDMTTGKATQWTESEVGGLDTSQFVRPMRIFYNTFDTVEIPLSPEELQARAAAAAAAKKKPKKPLPTTKPVARPIPAYYFRPPHATKEHPAAVVISIHGGPESQYRPYLSTFDQYLLNELGIAVLRPNVRGSAGYGKSYVRLDNGRKREDSVKDIGALLDWIKETETVPVIDQKTGKPVQEPKTGKIKTVTRRRHPELDPDRVAVMGGSYGGYMVLGSLTHYSKRIKCGIDIVGIASFATFLKNTSAYRRDLRRAEYGDERNPEMQKFFARIDPVNNAGKITAALYVAHGRNDPRVPFSEATQIVKKVESSGRKVWTVYADNEGHGFRKKENRDYLYATMILFLQKNLAPPR